MSNLKVVMFVLNPITFDRRVLREAASLSEAGCEVTVYGTTPVGSTTPSRETHPDGFAIVRVPMPPRSSMWSPRRQDFVEAWRGLRAGPWSLRRVRRVLARVPWWATKSVIAALVFLLHVASRGHASWMLNGRARWWAWGRAVLDDVPPADVYHGHDLTGLGLAVAARRRRGGRVVYDSHDLFLEAGANATRPRLVRRLLRGLEQRWYDNVDLLVTVNAGVAAELMRRYGSVPTAIVHNCVPSWQAPSRSDVGPLRLCVEIGREVPLVLYHGGFTANRGLGTLMRAMLEPGLEEAHLALLGYGPMDLELRRLAQHPQYGGRVHVLPAVPPEELDMHIADADVAAMVNQPASLNEVLSTPNKLFEAIAAGVPIVTSDFPMRRQIVLDNPDGPLGAVCDPVDSASIGLALRSILELPEAEMDRLRARCRHAARAQWNWARESASLLRAYGEMFGVPEPSPAPSAQPGLHRAE
jgi:glycogen(starch) synthase